MKKTVTRSKNLARTLRLCTSQARAFLVKEARTVFGRVRSFNCSFSLASRLISPSQLIFLLLLLLQFFSFPQRQHKGASFFPVSFTSRACPQAVGLGRSRTRRNSSGGRLCGVVGDAFKTKKEDEEKVFFLLFDLLPLPPSSSHASTCSRLSTATVVHAALDAIERERGRKR